MQCTWKACSSYSWCRCSVRNLFHCWLVVLYIFNSNIAGDFPAYTKKAKIVLKYTRKACSMNTFWFCLLCRCIEHGVQLRSNLITSDLLLCMWTTNRAQFYHKASKIKMYFLRKYKNTDKPDTVIKVYYEIRYFDIWSINAIIWSTVRYLYMDIFSSWLNNGYFNKKISKAKKKKNNNKKHWNIRKKTLCDSEGYFIPYTPQTMWF